MATQPQYFDYGGFSPETMELYKRNRAWKGGNLSDSNVQQVNTAIDIFKKQFKNSTGQDPTAQDIDSFAKNALYSAWNQAGDLGYADTTGLANYFIQSNYPEQIAGKGKNAAPGQYGAVDQAFQSTLGRTATQEERDHFGGLLASGGLDAYQLQDFLKQLPENVTKQDAEFRKNLSGELQAADSQYFGEQILPTIQRNFANQGRSVESSGFANAAVQAAAQQNKDRENWLGQLSAQQYGGRQDAARQDYMGMLGRYYGQQDYGMQRGNQLTDTALSHLGQVSDFNMQKQAYDQYLSRYGKKNSWVNDLSTGLNLANSATNLFKGWGGGSGGGQ